MRPPVLRRMRPSNVTLASAALAALSAAVPMAWLWGFTVDDALISARVAHQLATGHGYRFNPSGSIVDAVTPLGWAPLLTPFAAHDPWDAMVAAKWLGAGAWLLAAGIFGNAPARSRQMRVYSRRGGPAFYGSARGLGSRRHGNRLGDRAGDPGARLGQAGALRSRSGRGAKARTSALGAGVDLGRRVVFRGSAPARLRRAAMGLAFAFGPFLLAALLRQWLFGAAYPLSCWRSRRT